LVEVRVGKRIVRCRHSVPMINLKRNTHDDGISFNLGETQIVRP
jgi:hypothetical protein